MWPSDPLLAPNGTGCWSATRPTTDEKTHRTERICLRMKKYNDLELSRGVSRHSFDLHSLMCLYLDSYSISFVLLIASPSTLKTADRGRGFRISLKNNNNIFC